MGSQALHYELRGRVVSYCSFFLKRTAVLTNEVRSLIFCPFSVCYAMRTGIEKP
jgi:hypothetical protein